MGIKVFVGSSTEAVKIDRKIGSILEDLGADVIGWRDIFQPGDYPLEALGRLANTADAAILICSADDVRLLRGRTDLTPRDNIVFETGMLISYFGRSRTGIVHVRTGDSHSVLPSDLGGLTTIIYDPERPRSNERRLEAWLDNVGRETCVDNRGRWAAVEAAVKRVDEMPRGWQMPIDHFVIEPLINSLSSACDGQIVLSQAEYFSVINEEMGTAEQGTHVIAVVTLSSSLWATDDDQNRYIDKNIEAASRGVDIKRLFVSHSGDWSLYRPALERMSSAGIQIRKVSNIAVNDEQYLEDAVIFVGKDGATRAYVADQSLTDKKKIRRGRIILNESHKINIIKAFTRTWERSEKISVGSLPSRASPPGRGMVVHHLPKAVVSCEEAAQTKEIPLSNELKTLLLWTSEGYIALHLPGDGRASLRKIKRTLGVREAAMASPSQLHTFGLVPGTVCAVLDPIWNLPHLISARVFDMDFVSTNNGTLQGYYRFPPKVLREAEVVQIGDYEC